MCCQSVVSSCRGNTTRQHTRSSAFELLYCVAIPRPIKRPASTLTSSKATVWRLRERFFVFAHNAAQSRVKSVLNETIWFKMKGLLKIVCLYALAFGLQTAVANVARHPGPASIVVGRGSSPSPKDPPVPAVRKPVPSPHAAVPAPTVAPAPEDPAKFKKSPAPDHRDRKS